MDEYIYEKEWVHVHVWVSLYRMFPMLAGGCVDVQG